MYFKKKNHEKASSSTYSECSFVAPGVQHVMHMHHIVICGLSDSKIYFFLHYLTKGTSLEQKVIQHKMRVIILRCVIPVVSVQ